MDENKESIIFKLSIFDADILATLKDSYPADFESIGRDILKGNTFVYKVYVGEILCGILVNRVDVNYQGNKEFVILHTVKVQDIKNLNFFEIINAGEKQVAEKFGCAWIRRHIDRPGMAPVLEKYGYEAVEVIYKRKVQECQVPLKVPMLPKRLTRIIA